MPMASITATLVYSHDLIASRLREPLLEFLRAILLSAVGGLLLPFAGLMPMLAAFLSLWRFGARVEYNEFVYSLLLLLVAAVLVWRARAPSFRRSVLLALAVGITLLFRSPLAFFPPLLALAEWAFLQRRSVRAYWKHALILCVVPYLLLLPWVWMNWTVHRSLIPLEDKTADSNIVAGALGLIHTTTSGLPALVDDPAAMARPHGVYRWALKEIRAHPGRSLLAYARRIGNAFLYNPVLYFLAAAGLWIHRRRQGFWQLGLFAAYFLAIHCFMAIEERYFQPLFPLLILLGASLIVPASAPAEVEEAGPSYRLAVNVMRAFFCFFLALALYVDGVVGRYAERVRSDPGSFETALDDALSRNPDELWLLSRRAERSLLLGQVPAAAADLARIVARRPHEADFDLRLAWARMLEGEPAQLLAWPAESDAETEFEAHVFKAHGFLRLGRGDEARAELAAAWRLHQLAWRPADDAEEIFRRSSDRGFLVRSFGLLGNRPIAEKLALIGGLLQVDPVCRTCWIEQASLAASAGDPGLTLLSASRASALKPSRDETLRLAVLSRGAWIGQASAAAGTADPAIALRALSQALASQPDDGTILRIAGLYRQLKEYRRALNLLDGLAARRPQDSGVWIERARAALGAGLPELAMSSLSRGETSRDRDDLLKVAMIYQDARRYDKALVVLKGLVRDHPGDAELFKDLGVCEFQSGLVNEAIRDLRTALGLDPRMTEARLSLSAIVAAPRR